MASSHHCFQRATKFVARRNLSDPTNSEVIGKVYVSVKSTPVHVSRGDHAPFVIIANNGFRREFLGCVAR